MLSVKCMGGFITERHFAAAECEFPGIQRFYEQLVRKPTTFLELVWEYEHPPHAEVIASDRSDDAPRPTQPSSA